MRSRSTELVARCRRSQQLKLCYLPASRVFPRRGLGRRIKFAQRCFPTRIRGLATMPCPVRSAELAFERPHQPPRSLDSGCPNRRRRRIGLIRAYQNALDACFCRSPIHRRSPRVLALIDVDFDIVDWRASRRGGANHLGLPKLLDDVTRIHLFGTLIPGCTQSCAPKLSLMHRRAAAIRLAVIVRPVAHRIARTRHRPTILPLFTIDLIS